MKGLKSCKISCCSIQSFVLMLVVFSLVSIFVNELLTHLLAPTPNSALTPMKTVSMDDDHHHEDFSIFRLSTEMKVTNMNFITPTDHLCTYWNCMESYKCVGDGKGKISIYVYDVVQYVDEDGKQLLPPPTNEYLNLIWTLSQSKYAVSDPATACIMIPSIDLLNMKRVVGGNAAKILASLPYWNNGSNHLLFNMMPYTATETELLDFPIGKAMTAGSSFTQHSYRRTFDIPIPFFNPFQNDTDFVRKKGAEPFLLVSAQNQIYEQAYTTLKSLSAQNDAVLVVTACADVLTASRSKRCDPYGNIHVYPEILTKSKYCLITKQQDVTLFELHDILRARCVPVIASNSVEMPFSEVLDWKRAAVFITESQLDSVVQILEDVNKDTSVYETFVDQGWFLYQHYFESMAAIGNTVLDVLNDRVLPHRSKPYSHWNRDIIPHMPKNPFFIPLLPSEKQGFTAVILSYDRIDLLKIVISNIAKAKHISKILVVWNNQQLSPPSSFGNTNVPIKVIQTKYNRLSNRFYPYNEIETDCVLTIDDDIIMVPPEELDFAYRVWLENSDRLVGFPPRSHDLDTSGWKYESEWMSNISMVLTGVAFYHKYYHFLFTSSLPDNLVQWIDEHMNCEDVAMNYLIANTTGKAPIKVLPRKKFKVNSSGISASIITHLVARSTCMQYFTKAFGVMPLRTVDFRADPVLYKVDAVPESVQWYHSDGAL